ncbi:MAG: TIGR01906 family membrane protein [Oscillospiraceae bacterium]|jgi:integral membrane protein (TIGR01906 family)|nr:TIGR01906 family membrane protein [Oscillospiraceae bacterium]
MKSARIAAALAAVFLLLFSLYAAIASFTFDAAQYPTDAPFGEMAAELIAYLKGERAALSDTLFTERERLHMIDVAALFAGGRRIALGALCGAVALLALAAWRGGRKAIGQGVLIGIGAFMGLVAFIGLWALIDFDGWFTAMHQIVFTNDLWLLDPADSMLIQMLPIEFFMKAVRVIALRFLALLGLLALVAWLLNRRPRGMGR